MINILPGNVRFCSIVLIVSILGLLSGLTQHWPSPIFSQLSTNENPMGRALTAAEQNWMVSLPYLGGLLGPPMSGLIMEKWGRKSALFGAYVPGVVCSLAAALGTQTWHLYLSRATAGMSAYSGLIVAAVYLGEIADGRYRGVVYSSIPLSVSAGMLMCFWIGLYASISQLHFTILAVALLGLMVTGFLPESPYYLLQRLQSGNGGKSLSLLRNSDDILGELTLIQAHVAKTGNLQSKAVRKSFGIVPGLVILAQFSGSVAIRGNIRSVFLKTGWSISDNAAGVVIGTIQIFSSVFNMGVDWMGRKNMLTFASFALAFLLGILGIYFQFLDESMENYTEITWLPLLIFMGYFLLYYSSLSSLPLLYITEIMPLNVKSLTGGFLMALQSLLSFLLVFFYDHMVKGLGTSGYFYVSSIAMLGLALYVQIMLFETKGRSLDEIFIQMNKSKRSKEAFSKNAPENGENL
ncbi:hypothetical protein HUJ04_005543 [Dendroctonus ponderosae]|uniref:Major facilitator superfamily (MFS) profile domain-containing protein n=1 Tax=Dendroctonus ponderosae TaxID=77166 RepID=A0AAR5PTG4_DENPD|nr:hypothetical protein HUJ04_005543 [Dendroctonus ponderosae]